MGTRRNPGAHEEPACKPFAESCSRNLREEQARRLDESSPRIVAVRPREEYAAPIQTSGARDVLAPGPRAGLSYRSASHAIGDIGVAQPLNAPSPEPPNGRGKQWAFELSATGAGRRFEAGEPYVTVEIDGRVIEEGSGKDASGPARVLCGSSGGREPSCAGRLLTLLDANPGGPVDMGMEWRLVRVGEDEGRPKRDGAGSFTPAPQPVHAGADLDAFIRTLVERIRGRQRVQAAGDLDA